MGAVVEPASLSQVGQVVEQQSDAVRHIGQLQFAHTGRVDQPPPLGHRDQIAGGGGVAALGVILADTLNGCVDRRSARSTGWSCPHPTTPAGSRSDPCGTSRPVRPAPPRHGRSARPLTNRAAIGGPVYIHRGRRRSALVSTTTGSIPALAHSTRYRSNRPTLKSLLHDDTISAVSTLAAINCRAMPVPAALRCNSEPAVQHPQRDHAARQDPVAHRDIAGVQVGRRDQLQRPIAAQGIDAVAVHAGYPGRGRCADFVQFQLAQEIGGPAKVGQQCVRGQGISSHTLQMAQRAGSAMSGARGA